MNPAQSLELLRAANFDYTLHLRSIWSDPPADVPELQSRLRQEFQDKLEAMRASADVNSPRGWVVLGPGGSGKTHLLTAFRRMAQQNQAGFVLVDMTDVRDFWDAVLLGYWSSLQEVYDGERFQHEVLLERFLHLFKIKGSIEDALLALRSARPERLAQGSEMVLTSLFKRYPGETRRYQDVIRALMALNSSDFGTANVGLAWLQGHEIEESIRKTLGFQSAGQKPKQIVEALSWLMGLVGPTVLAFDQLDPIVAQLNLDDLADQLTTSSPAEIVAAKAIVEGVGHGLMALHHSIQRTLVVVSGLEATIQRLFERVKLASANDRFEPTKTMEAINHSAIAAQLVAQRMQAAWHRLGGQPPYPTWHFRPSCFAEIQGVSPRALLKVCDEHRNRCLRQGKALELESLTGDPVASPIAASSDHFATLDARFQDYSASCNLEELLDETTDDERLAPLMRAVCRAWIHEYSERLTSADIDPLLDGDLQGGKTTRALHARLRRVFRREGDREDHTCLRALQRTHPSAFQARLKAAMTLSGIDQRLRFRRLLIFRTTPLPSGRVTLRLLEQFRALGGHFIQPSENDWRVLTALMRLFDENHPMLVDWLRARRPATSLSWTALALPDFDDSPTAERPIANSPEAQPAAVSPPEPPALAAPPIKETHSRSTDSPGAPKNLTEFPRSPRARDILLGRRLPTHAPQTIPLANLDRHAVILAGAGSGKTVLVRRIIEEAALCGIPAIVIDCANDLATLGDPWPSPPEAWLDGDAQKSHAYLHGSEVVVWTPNRETGRPLVLDPLPDFNALADQDDELKEAVDLAKESLRSKLGLGTTDSGQKKAGILHNALMFFARQGGGTLNDLVELMTDFPPEAHLGIDKEAKLAREMADRLRVDLTINPLLRGRGQAIDPAILFGAEHSEGRTRISVINLQGLPSLEMQRDFLNQLAMLLFAWIRKHPRADRPLQGLLVIDEARDFIPSQKTSACKESLKRLAAQARKYHLGLIFATQHPREIDNQLVGNCSTQFFGKANSPSSIETIRDQIAQRGGHGHDVATLPKGTFYFYSSDIGLNAPVKIQVPMCLSHHGPHPLAEEEILVRARRDALAGNSGSDFPQSPCARKPV